MDPTPTALTTTPSTDAPSTPQRRRPIHRNPNRCPTLVRTPISIMSTGNQILPVEPQYITATTRALVVPARPTLSRVFLEIIYRLPNILIPGGQFSLESALNLRCNARTIEQLRNSCTLLATYIAHQRSTSLSSLFSQMLLAGKYIISTQSLETPVLWIILDLTPAGHQRPLNTADVISHLRASLTMFP